MVTRLVERRFLGWDPRLLREPVAVSRS
jgi:hypothetical protein